MLALPPCGATARPKAFTGVSPADAGTTKAATAAAASHVETRDIKLLLRHKSSHSSYTVTQKDLQQVSGIKIRNIPYIALILLTESRCGLLVPSFDKRRCRDLKRIRG